MSEQYIPTRDAGFANAQLYRSLKHGELGCVQQRLSSYAGRDAALQVLALIRLELRLGNDEDLRARLEDRAVTLMQQLEQL